MRGVFANYTPSIAAPLHRLHRQILAIEFVFLHRRLDLGIALNRRPRARREHGAPSRLTRSECTEPHRDRHIHVNGFGSPAPQVRLVPETCAARILDELLPPLQMHAGARPSLKRFEITPVLPHAEMPQRKEEVFME